ncbi:anti sigma factor C-terminal domain-containing protein [Isachenkonia alkalipeptolytica]|uniref:Sigma factor regulator C-terminal domain-containing protein n=1 Tax=Isachenkonia alkalipeptolytica TaxID=2565777 RepID=A0AA43XJ63_9CLOT|nr:anti sigma factor C-terminal domain-containing protein [Isachenkonia alkalipeptolytica]NBG87722.1 hypothetical protein [Isachenkonia alkalipeptolytica]
MNFKEIFRRYQAGEATEEERKYIEEEMEKFEFMETYFSEQEFTEDVLKDQGKKEDPQEQNEDNSRGKDSVEYQELKNIQKLVNRRLGKVIIASVLAVVLLYLGIFYGVSSIVDRMHYDPTATNQIEDGDYPISDFTFDFAAYVSLNKPGYSVVGTLNEKSLGFGEYELQYLLIDNVTKERNYFQMRQIRDGKQNDFDSIYYLRDFLGGFNVAVNPESYNKDTQDATNERMIEHLEKLNPASFVSSYVTFHEDLSMEEIYEMSRAYSDIDIGWVGVRTYDPEKAKPHQLNYLTGFTPDFRSELIGDYRPDWNEYPYFNIGDINPNNEPISMEDYPEIYETHYLSRLRYLRDRPEFVKIFDAGPEKTDYYEEAVEYIEENGVHSFGVLVYGEAEDLLDYFDGTSSNVKSLTIDQVLPSRPFIY